VGEGTLLKAGRDESQFLTATLLGLIVLVAAVIRLILIAHAPAFVLFGDSHEFYLTGQQLVLTGEFHPPLKRAPPVSTLPGRRRRRSLGPRLESRRWATENNLNKQMAGQDDEQCGGAGRS
jgi:hypothetical protein